MKNFKLFVFVSMSLFLLNSCSNDDKNDCRKVKSSSGRKENGVMVYRVTLDDGTSLVVNKATAEYYIKPNATKECYSLK